MQSPNSENLNAKETAELLSQWKADYLVVVSDITEAIRKLDEVKNELSSAKKIYEKSWPCVFKENFTVTCFGVVALILGIVYICLSQPGSLKADLKNGVLEKSAAQ